MVQPAGELHVNAGAVVADKADFSFLTHLISGRSAAFGLYIGSGACRGLLYPSFHWPLGAPRWGSK